MDSAAFVTGDSVFYFNPVIVSAGGPAIDSNNIFGCKMIRKPDSEYAFVVGLDTLVLRPLDTLNASWPFNTSGSVTATLTGKGPETFNGQTDSVVTISLSKGDTIKISKNYGFISTIDFKGLVNRAYTRTYTLHAIPEAGIGQDVFDPFEVYNYDVGDVFGYNYTIKDNGIITCIDYNIIKEVLNKQVFDDSLVYTYKYTERAIRYNYSGYCGVNGIDTLIIDTVLATISKDGIKQDSLLIKGTSEFNSRYIKTPTYWFLDSTGQGLSRSGRPVVKDTWAHNRWRIDYAVYNYDPGLKTISVVLDIMPPSFILGLGDVEDFGGDYQLTCYKKATDSSGNCHDLLHNTILSVSSPVSDSQLSLSPNPAHDFIQIGLNGSSYSWEIYSASGVKAVQGSANKGETIPVSNLSPGLYLINVKSGQSVGSLKFLKR